MVSAPTLELASRIAWRSEPGPLSFVLVTTKGLVGSPKYRLQPPLMAPVLPKPSSSTTYRLQVPFGSVPLKTERLGEYGALGAAGGNVSELPSLLLVGLKEPDSIAHGT